MGSSWRIVLIVAAAALAVSCSSDQPAAKPAPQPGSSPAAVAMKEPCALLGGDVVGKAIARQQVTGAPGPHETVAANNGKAKTCVYSADGKQVGALAVTRYDGNKVKPAQMVAAIKAKKAGAKEVPGLAEGAVYYVEDGKAATLAAAKLVNGVPVLVSYSGPAKMTAEMITPLVKQAVDAS